MPAASMSVGQAENVIITSALVVGGAYAYRRLIESAGVPVSHPLPSFARWATGYGIAFTGVSVIATASPGLGGWLAVLIAAGTLLVQGGQLASDVQGRLSSGKTTTTSTTAPASTKGATK